jgi:aspartate/methionine/tyrosine aminotransferase
MSKAYSLPGIRLGWIVSPNEEIIHQVTLARDYTTISVSQVDQEIAAFALAGPVRERIFARSLSICQQNLARLDEFVREHNQQLSWVKPTGASSGFVKVVSKIDGQQEDDRVFCERLIQETGLLIVPGGWAFGTEAEEDFKGYLRIGFVCEPVKFQQNLEIFDEYLRRKS